MKLIKLRGHFYVLSDKKHISHKIGDWVYETNNCIPVYQFSYDMDEYPLFRVLAATIKLGTLPLIDFNQLQELMLDVLSKEHYPDDSSIHVCMRETWIERYMNNLSGLFIGEIKDESKFIVELEMEEYFLFKDTDDNDKVIPHFRPKVSNNGFINILKIKK